MSVGESVANQTETSYENWKKLKTLVDVGFFLQNYIVEGGVVTKDVTYNNMIDVTEIVVSLDNDVTRREATSFKTKVASTIYYLDYQAGDFTFNTLHPSGSYLPVAEVTTDINKNVLVITDKRGPVGGFRLLSEYGLTGVVKSTLVTDFGADPTGIVDSAAAFQAAVNSLLSTGGTVYIPAGKYKIGTKIDVDLSGNVPQVSGKGISIRGDNMNTTILLNATGSDYVFNVHSTGATEAGNAHFHAENFTITKTTGTTTGGIKMSGFSQSSLQNILFYQLGDKSGLYMEDIVTCSLINCRFSQNTYGLTAPGQVTFSAPNAIDLHSCVFYGNGRYAAYFKSGCNINFFGGTVETSGGDTSTGLRWGVKLDGLGQYGAGGSAFYGVYFEGNQNSADVWINHTDYSATYKFDTCTFNRFADPNNSQHNIRLDTNSNLNVAAKLVVNSCGFRSFPGYVPDSSKRVIQVYGSTPTTFEESGNFYNNQADRPGPTSNRLFAHGRFIGLAGTPSIFRAFNVASITRNAVGDYTITFISPSINNEKITTIGMDILGFTQVVAETTTTIRIKTFNASSVATDPAQLSFHSYE